MYFADWIWQLSIETFNFAAVLLLQKILIDLPFSYYHSHHMIRCKTDTNILLEFFFFNVLVSIILFFFGKARDQDLPCIVLNIDSICICFPLGVIYNILKLFKGAQAVMLMCSVDEFYLVQFWASEFPSNEAAVCLSFPIIMCTACAFILCDLGSVFCLAAAWCTPEANLSNVLFKVSVSEPPGCFPKQVSSWILVCACKST